MRAHLVVLLLLLSANCSTITPRQAENEGPYGLTLTEEATVLRLEDRREYDAAIAQQWMRHENALHRARMALALGRIGAHTFADSNSNGVKDDGEQMAGVELLTAAANDPAYEVRRNVAFALGEIGDPAGVATLLLLARDREHADVAAEAVEALSKLSSSVPLASYRELIDDEREGVRTRALRFLFRFGSDEAMSVAQQYLTATGVNDRREAAYALSRKAFAPGRARLELLLSDADTLTRAYAVRALGLIADAASAPALLAAISDQDPWVRTNAARSLVQLAEKHMGALRALPTSAEDALRVIALTEDADPGTRVSAIDLLGVYSSFNEPAKKQLMELAISGSRVQREVAAGAVARQHGGEAVEALLQTDSIWTKIRAIEASSGTSWGGDVRARLAIDPSATVRASAIGAIGAEPSAAELDALRRALADDDVMVRAAAADRFAALKNVSIDEKVAHLRAIENRSEKDLLNDARVAVVNAIGTLEFQEREAFLRERLNDRDPVVRRLAAEALANQLKKPRPQYTPLPVDRPISDYEEIVRWSRGSHNATIHMEGGARIEIALASLDAPMTAHNFATLAQRGYFDNTSFMRVVPNFVIQGGDPRNDMSGGPGYSIRDEINLQKYTRGAVGMALSGPDTGGSQFFITHSPQHHLDGGYTIFGRVTAGMKEVVDQIERGDRVARITIQ